MFDVCIIGAGPAGLSVLSALHNAEGILTETQWNQLHSHKKWNTSQYRRFLSVCVVDPSGSWLGEWNGRFQALQIDLLRSPAWATPDLISSAALIEFAWKTGREKELHQMSLTRKAMQSMRTLVDSGLFQQPGSALFRDFCAHIAKSLPHTMISNEVETILKGENDVYDIVFRSSGTSPVQARNVVLAVGSGGVPRIPPAFAATASTFGATVEHKQHEQGRVFHTQSWQQLLTLRCRNEIVAVIGGGLSAVQAALLAVHRGAAKVFLFSRRSLQSRHYDLPLEWLDSRAGWSTAAKDKSKKMRLYEFYATPVEERLAWVQSARGGATVPPSYVSLLNEAVREGKVELVVDEVCECTNNDKSNPSSDEELLLRLKSGRVEVNVSRVILATGCQLDIDKVPLLSKVARSFHLPVIDALPCLNEQLQWGENENFFVVGALALLQVGPDAGNLSGCRRSAIICAHNFGAFTSMEGAGGPLNSIYQVLQNGTNKTSHSAEYFRTDDRGNCSKCHNNCRRGDSLFTALSFDSDSDGDNDADVDDITI